MSEETALATIDVMPSDLAVRRDPEVVLGEAKKAAQALQSVIAAKPNKVMFGKQQYLQFDDWQTVGKFYGITVKVTSTKFVSYNLGDRQVSGFEAAADAIVAATGAVVSAGEAMCLNDEEKWSTRPQYEYRDLLDKDGKKIWDPSARGGKGGYKFERVQVGDVSVPLFQLRSMAQTRACAKALRNCLSWVVVLAGYAPTPAEEMIGNERDQHDDDARDDEEREEQPSKGHSGRGEMGKCPACGAKAIIKGKEEFGGGYVCWKNKGGCGAKFETEADLKPKASQPQGNRPKPGAPF